MRVLVDLHLVREFVASGAATGPVGTARTVRTGPIFPIFDFRRQALCTSSSAGRSCRGGHPHCWDLLAAPFARGAQARSLRGEKCVTPVRAPAQHPSRSAFSLLPDPVFAPGHFRPGQTLGARGVLTPLSHRLRTTSSSAYLRTTTAAEAARRQAVGTSMAVPTKGEPGSTAIVCA